MNVAIIGAGGVGSELARKLSSNKLVTGLVATRRNRSKLIELGEELKIKVTNDNKEAVKTSDIVLLAVKPQEMKKAIQEISSELLPEQILVSVSVGLEISFYEKLIPNNPIIRVMPNPFLSNNLGIIAYSVNRKTAKKEVEIIRDLFEPMCEKLIEIPDEKMHLFTTLASSTSAIFYYIFNSCIEKAKQENLDEEIAKEIILASAKASSLHAIKSEKSMEQLINFACTPGGMTIDGIKYLQDKKVEAYIKEAIQKITDRSVAINKEAD